MKIKCPDCRQRFEIDENEYDEGDYLNCPECNLEMTVIIKDGKLKVKPAKERDLDSEEESEGFEEFEEE